MINRFKSWLGKLTPNSDKPAKPEVLPCCQIWRAIIAWDNLHIVDLFFKQQPYPPDKYTFYSNPYQLLQAVDIAEQWPSKYPDLYLPWLNCYARQFAIAVGPGIITQEPGSIVPELCGNNYPLIRQLENLGLGYAQPKNPR